MTQPHSTAGKLPIGRPFVNGRDPRRNAGGRPLGPATLARDAVGGGRDLIDFYLAVFKGDAKALGTRRITLRDRIQAAEWLAERGWGKAPVVVDLPEEPQVDFNDALQGVGEVAPAKPAQGVGQAHGRRV